MQKIFNFIIDKRYLFLSLFILVAGLSIALMSNVNINNDFTQYLPDDSQTKIGYEVLEDEFGTTSSLKVVFEDLNGQEITTILNELLAIPDVSAVDTDDSTTYNVDNYRLFIIRISDTSTSEAAHNVLDTVEENYPDAIIGGEIYTHNQPLIPFYMLALAFIILMILLFAFTSSWIEPLLFLFTIGIAIVINMGTNVIFDSVSMTTHSIAALLQLCLSIDYSIILLNRYRQEKTKDISKSQAMKNAMLHAFPSISGSSLTTIVGLLCLLFMSFTIGADMGLVLAKGVFISMLTVFFVLPAVILIFDKIIEKTSKKSIHLNVKRMSNFGFKSRFVAPIIFILLFVGSFFLRGNTEIGFVLPATSIDEASEIFQEDNVILILYDNDDEENIATFIDELNDNENILSISAYSTTIGQKYSASELAQMTGFDVNQISGILMLSGIEEMSLYDFVYLVYDNYSSMLTAEQLQQLTANLAILETSKDQLVGSEYSRAIISTDLSADSETTRNFIEQLMTKLDNDLSGTHYVIGESVMATEISTDFDAEFLKITLITIVAIFIVVALTFKSIFIPTILVTIIQTAIFVTTGVLGFLGANVYFLALIIVQAILMGATIDYGILFTSYFREKAKILPIKEALKEAYKGSTHTILTSASILFFVTGLLAIITSDPTISQVLKALAVGTMSSTLLVLFALPSILVLMKRFIVRK